MPPDAVKYLSDMLDRATFVRQYLLDKTLDDLISHRPIRSAAERELMVLGEAMYMLHRKFPEIAGRIDSWNQIIHFRHVLVHGYEAVSMQVIWDVVHDDLDPLIARLHELLLEKGS
jgi:uncharacterized protein with HEPN domain